MHQRDHNRLSVILAPHVLYTKHGELHIDAVTIEREGAPPREAKVGTFKLTGLNDVMLTERTFDRSPVFEPEAERYIDQTLFMIE